jgi:hypothetical protein
VQQEVVRAAVKSLADGLASQQAQTAQLQHMLGVLRRQSADKADRSETERIASAAETAAAETAALKLEVAALREELRGDLADLRCRVDAKPSSEELATRLETRATVTEVPLYTCSICICTHMGSLH